MRRDGLAMNCPDCDRPMKTCICGQRISTDSQMDDSPYEEGLRLRGALLLRMRMPFGAA